LKEKRWLLKAISVVEEETQQKRKEKMDKRSLRNKRINGEANIKDAVSNPRYVGGMSGP
jgi:hypothetical protein